MTYAHIIIDPIDYTEVAENLRAHAANVLFHQIDSGFKYYCFPEFPQKNEFTSKSRGSVLLGNLWNNRYHPITKFLWDEIVFGLYDCVSREQECLYALFLAEYLESDFPAYLESLQQANAS